jgi:hypothetical protein
MRSQVAVTEYMVLVFMIAIIIFFAVILIFGFEVFTVGSEQMTSRERTAMFTLQSFLSSSVLNDPDHPKGSVFDDSRLTAADCSELEQLFGEDWYAEVRVVTDTSPCDGLSVWMRRACLRGLYEKDGTVCSEQNYPECGTWSFCEKADRMVYRSVPVNIYRKINGTMEIGVLTVGVPSGG